MHTKYALLPASLEIAITLRPKKGWEKVKCLGNKDEYNINFLLVRGGWFGTSLFAPTTVVHFGADNLRIREPFAGE